MHFHEHFWLFTIYSIIYSSHYLNIHPNQMKLLKQSTKMHLYSKIWGKCFVCLIFYNKTVFHLTATYTHTYTLTHTHTHTHQHIHTYTPTHTHTHTHTNIHTHTPTYTHQHTHTPTHTHTCSKICEENTQSTFSSNGSRAAPSMTYSKCYYI